MANNDRVSELYRGEIFGRESQRICRDRIDWLVASCRGRVLDIGCSQGIASLLAARAGHHVVGVDAEEPAIEFARRDLLEEPDDVQQRLRFVLGDILAPDLHLGGSGDRRFDTVLLGEILEHHADPRRLFERASGFLADDGLLVVTTPFGLHVHHDHRTTFYMANFAETVAGLCAPRSLDVVEGFIRFTAGHRDADAELSLDPPYLLALDEAAFLRREHRVYERDQERKELVRKGTEARAALAAEKKAATRVERELVAREKELADLRDHVRRVEEQRDQIAGALRETQLRHAPRGPLLKRLLDALAPDGSPGSRARQEKAKRKRRRGDGDFAPYEPFTDARPSAPRIATILDEFSQRCFEYEADLVVLDTTRWRQQMTEQRPAMLLAESAWRGNGGQWRYLFSKYATREPNPLRELLAWCRDNDVPTVFWNKEDPPNFDVFKDVAREFDFVFTTDADCIPRYRELCGHDRVFALPFAAQPVLHNPVSDDVPRERPICFAGSWRADKYPERVADSKMLLTAAMEFGLDIFDRFAGTPDAEKFQFPEPFRSRVRGSLAYDRMLSAYRAYKVFLNVNSVTESPTMFARRVFELMACGTPVVSSESLGIRKILGAHVPVVTTQEQAVEHLRRLMENDEYRARFAHAGYRHVMTEHTYARRLADILTEVGLDVPAASAPPVTIVTATNRPEQLENLVANAARQVHPNLEFIVVLNADDYDEGAVREAVAACDNASVLRRPQSATLAECLNAAIERASGDFIAKFDDDDHYGAHYVSDLLLTRHYTSAPIVGKQSYYAFVSGRDCTALRFPGKSHRHTQRVCGATLFVQRDVFRDVKFTPVQRGTDSAFLADCNERGIAAYSADPFNYMCIRRADLESHTWQIQDDEFLKNCIQPRPGKDLDGVMI